MFFSGVRYLYDRLADLEAVTMEELLMPLADGLDMRFAAPINGCMVNGVKYEAIYGRSSEIAEADSQLLGVRIVDAWKFSAAAENFPMFR